MTILKKVFIFCLLLLFFSNLTYALAGESTQVVTGQPTSGAGTNLDNPLGAQTSPQALIGKVIQAAMGIVGSIALAMFIYGGFVWMTAAGNAESITKGKNILIWATLGLVVIFSAYALVRFVFKGLGIAD